MDVSQLPSGLIVPFTVYTDLTTDPPTVEPRPEPRCEDCGGPMHEATWEVPCCGGSFDCVDTMYGMECDNCGACYDDW